VGDPLNFDVFDAVSHVLNRDVEWVCATPEQAYDRAFYESLTQEVGWRLG